MVFYSLSPLRSLRIGEASQETRTGQNNSDNDRPISTDCVFCRVSAGNGFDVVWEDSTFTVFRDHNPSTILHLQVIPKKHVESIKFIRKNDVEMIKSMGAIGHRILDSLDVPMTSRRLGFHIPPFNSINHLHLHLQGLPYKHIIRKFKYPVVQGKGSNIKGLSWFVDLEQTVKILERGGVVSVFPC